MAPSRSARTSPQQIADRIVDAILAGRVLPGQRLGEQALADLFGVSRTLVREAMARLSARGMVNVDARRGWFVLEPSLEEAKEAFSARVAVETGMLHALEAPVPRARLQQLKQHIKAEQAAIRAGEPGQRSYLLGDFHVCLAECLGGPLMADILRDLTARTTLIASLFQSTHDAAQSCADHAQIVAALQAGDIAGAIDLTRTHIGTVQSHLRLPSEPDDPLAGLRDALVPRRRLFSDLMPSPTPDPQPEKRPCPPAATSSRSSPAQPLSVPAPRRRKERSTP
jgi:DNA-binding GntR family transcriptional regulator